MKVLAVDTSGGTVSAAVVADGQVTGELFLNNGLTHSQTLMPLIDSLLDYCGIQPKEIEGFAVAVGPGSFTGIRIGIGVVKGMAGNHPCFAVNSLDALAYGARYFDGTVCAMLDARNGEVYTAVYRNGKRTDDYMACNINAAINELSGDMLFVGDGAIANKSIIIDYPNALIASENLMYPKATNIGLMAEEIQPCAAHELLPFYLKQSSAERNME